MDEICEKDGFKVYIGTKIIQATSMTELDFRKSQGKELDGENSEGYCVVYEDGYKSWSPKNVFERAYREVTRGEKGMIGELSTLAHEGVISC